MLQTMGQVALGWSLSLSHPPEQRDAARRLHLMTQDLLACARRAEIDLLAAWTLYRPLCRKFEKHGCVCATPGACPRINPVKITP